MTSATHSCFSAPGKALLAGGYLVLDPQYKAYAVALSTRMHSVVSGRLVADDELSSTITVLSPQFKDGTWKYQWNGNINDSFTVEDRSLSKNPFLLATIDTIISYLAPDHHADISISIFSDPPYHSQHGATPRQGANGNNQFLFHDNAIKDVPKTGLGSSAGLVTVLTAALLAFYKPQIDLVSNDGLQLVHNLAQISHCTAQGKIGSGFDVGAATYGSIIYQRFDPKIIADLIKFKENAKTHKEYCIELQKIVNSKWDMAAQKCDLPPQIRILMGDVNNGSETPKLVSKVNAWKAANPEQGQKLFETLNFYNTKLVSELLNMTKISVAQPNLYKELISFVDDYSLIQLKQLIKISDASFVSKFEPLLDIIESISAIRHNLRILSKEAEADIEPSDQTILLDNCFTLPGVLGGVVPGAGGYDAICLLCSEIAAQKIIKLTDVAKLKDTKLLKEELAKLSKHDQELFDNVDLDSIDTKLFKNVTWLDLHEENRGLVKENIDNYVGLVE